MDEYRQSTDIPSSLLLQHWKPREKGEDVTSIIDNQDESIEAKSPIEERNNNLINVSRSVIYASTAKTEGSC